MKIAFLAMSGIRAHDPELLRLGLTLPGFVERSRTVASLPSLGLLSIAATTPPGHELHYCEAEAAGREPAELVSFDLVAISTFSAQVEEAYAIADRLRAAGVSVAMGGLHVSARPDEAAAHADYVAVGEGEPVWPEIVAAAERKDPPRIFRAADYPPVDLARLPMPRYDLLGNRPYNRYTVQTTRGCPWRCDFCASTVTLGSPYRKRPVADIVRDIVTIQSLHPGAFIEFADDNTFVDKGWGKELCRALAPLKIKWFTETDLSVAEDPEVLRLMAAAGCRQVLIGLESPTADGLSGLELRSDRKARWFHGYQAAIRAIQSHGITVNGCFILGLDAHDRRIFPLIRDTVEAFGLFDVQITLLTPFPGTPLYERLRKEGRLLYSEAWHLCTLFDVTFRPAHMTPEELREGIHWLSQEIYSAEATRRRRKAFFAQYRQEEELLELASSAPRASLPPS